jgi:hypothetical protein
LLRMPPAPPVPPTPERPRAPRRGAIQSRYPIVSSERLCGSKVQGPCGTSKTQGAQAQRRRRWFEAGEPGFRTTITEAPPPFHELAFERVAATHTRPRLSATRNYNLHHHLHPQLVLPYPWPLSRLRRTAPARLVESRRSRPLLSPDPGAATRPRWFTPRDSSGRSSGSVPGSVRMRLVTISELLQAGEAGGTTAERRRAGSSPDSCWPSWRSAPGSPASG